MTNERDPLERLRALNPVPAGYYDDQVWAPPARTLFEQIVAEHPEVAVGRALGRPGPSSTRSPSPRRRRRSTRVVVVAGAMTLSAGVAGYALTLRHPTKPQVVGCFASADLKADTAVVLGESRGAVAVCAAEWERGAFGPLATPTLRACVLETGVVGVFPEDPGQDVCLQLGLAEVAVATPAEDGSPAATSRPGDSRPGVGTVTDTERFLAFRDAAVARFLGQACVEPAVAASIVRDELARAGLEGWTVTTGGEGAEFSAERPCASLSFLPEVQTVVLVPFPPTG